MGNEAQERAVLVEERALQAAMIASDVEELDRLLHPDLLAVGPDGQLIDKAGDLGSHRSGVFRITELREEEVRVKVVGDTAVTFVVLVIRGTIADTARFTLASKADAPGLADPGPTSACAQRHLPARAAAALRDLRKQGRPT